MDSMGGMGHGGMTAVPPLAAMGNKKRLVMHMGFFWGTVTEVLFDKWPGTKGTGQYVLSLLFVFVLAVLLEGISRFRIGGASHLRRVVRGLLRTAVYTVRVGLAYLVMLAIMSFNGGVFLVIVAGHAVGFLIFRERVFGKSGGDDGSDKGDSDLNGMHC